MRNVEMDQLCGVKCCMNQANAELLCATFKSVTAYRVPSSLLLSRIMHCHTSCQFMPFFNTFCSAEASL